MGQVAAECFETPGTHFSLVPPSEQGANNAYETQAWSINSKGPACYFTRALKRIFLQIYFSMLKMPSSLHPTAHLFRISKFLIFKVILLKALQ